MEMLTTDQVAERLRGQGFKVTPQRLAVYHALARTKAHPNAETLFNELRPLYPTMSLATVYKALSILCEIGLAQELSLGEDSFRYDADTSHHPHIRCTVCGRVDDVPVMDTEAFTQKVAEDTGYSLTDYQVYFFGRCPACREARQVH